MAPPRTDLELLRSTDPDDFGVFYRRHVDALTSYVDRKTQRPDQTFDIVSETFARALAHRRSFDAQRAPAIAWLLAIAKNLIIDAARRGRIADETRRRLQHEPTVLTDADLRAVEHRSSSNLTDALQTLTPEQRELVLRRVLHDESYPALAEDVGCSEQVVRKRVSRALASLRRTIKEQQA